MDIDKLTPVPNDLAKLSNVVKNDVIKKTEYNKLVGKVGNIDTTKFILKTTYDTEKSGLEKKISDADKKIPHSGSSVKKKTDYSSKIAETETKIPSISGLATNSPLTAVENKIPNASSLVKITDHNTKVSEIEGKNNNDNHDKYITTPEFNNVATGIFDAKLAKANLVTKTDFNIKLKKISDGLTLNKTKHLLVETELKN